MKFLKLFIIAIIAGISVSAQTADDVIQKHVAAIGGADNWKKINTVRITGTVTAQGMEIPVIITIIQNKGFRVEYTVNGMTGYTVITDKAGWSFNPFTGQTKPEVMPDETVKQAQNGLDITGPLIDYAAKGIKVAYLGKDDVEGTDCHKLKVTFPNGKEETIYIDASNYYHIRTVEKMKANDKEIEQTSNFGNFEKLPEGIIYPMSIDNGGGPVAVKTVEINKPVDEKLFQMADDAVGVKK